MSEQERFPIHQGVAVSSVRREPPRLIPITRPLLYLRSVYKTLNSIVIKGTITTLTGNDPI
jgi:hypothetical protein